MTLLAYWRNREAPQYRNMGVAMIASKLKAEDCRLSRPLTQEECFELADVMHRSETPRKALEEKMKEMGIFDKNSPVLARESLVGATPFL